MPDSRLQNSDKQLLSTFILQNYWKLSLSLYPGYRTPISCLCCSQATGIPYGVEAYSKLHNTWKQLPSTVNIQKCWQLHLSTLRLQRSHKLLPKHSGYRNPKYSVCILPAYRTHGNGFSLHSTYRTPGTCISLHFGYRTPVSCISYTQDTENPHPANAYVNATEFQETACVYTKDRELL